MNRLTVIVSAVFLGLVSCEDPFPGYTEVTEDLHLKIYELGDGEVYPDTAHFVALKLQLTTLADSVIYSTPRNLNTVALARSFREMPGVLKPGLQRLMAGDSASLVARTSMLLDSDLRGFSDLESGVGDWVKVNLRVAGIYTDSELETMRKELQMEVGALIVQETEDLKEYLYLLSENPFEAYERGIYFFPKHKGSGVKPQTGDRLIVNYKAQFTDGTVFDDTYASGHPLEFRFGDPDQVIPGLEVGLSLMREGGSALIVVPFDMGFGVQGSSSGIVPPCKTLVYSTALTKIIRSKPQG